MKLHACVLILSSIFTICGAQSDKSLKLHITKTNLQSFSKVEQKPDLTNEGEKNTETYLNFNPVISFNGPQNSVTINEDFGDLSQVTIFTVYQVDEASKEQELWGIYGEESNLTLTTTDIAYADQVLSYEGGLIKTPILNTYVQSYRLKNGDGDQHKPQLLLGSFSGNESKAFKGNIAEIMVFDKVLRGKKRQVIETYLAIKYGITLDNGEDYLSSEKKLIYNIEDNAGYTYHIAGIGSDKGTGLNQKQSQSTEEASVLTIGLGKMAKSNLENKEELPIDHFLVWGDNNLEPIILSNDTYPIPVMGRQWKMQATGENISELKTSVQLDVSNSIKEAKKEESEYLMVIDRSGEGTYLPENTKYIQASSMENNIVSFENIQWDADSSGSDVFTFGLKKELKVTLAEAKPIGCDSDIGELSFDVKGGIPPYNYELLESDSRKEEWKSTEAKYSDKLLVDLPKGMYSLKVTDAIGTQTEAQYSLEAPIPIKVDLGLNRQFQLGEKEMVLDATVKSKDNLSYKWTSDIGYYSDQPVIKITSPGVYTVNVTSSKGCETSDSISISKSSVQSFNVFPNQSKDGNYSIHVKLKDQQEVNISVYDMLGRLISETNEKGKSFYNIPGAQIHVAGTYMIVLKGKDITITKKLIVE